MQEVIKEYGPALIAVVAVIALAGVVSVLMGGGTGGVVGQAFSDLIENFFEMANEAAKVG